MLFCLSRGKFHARAPVSFLSGSLHPNGRMKAHTCKLIYLWRRVSPRFPRLFIRCQRCRLIRVTITLEYLRTEYVDKRIITRGTRELRDPRCRRLSTSSRGFGPNLESLRFTWYRRIRAVELVTRTNFALRISGKSETSRTVVAGTKTAKRVRLSSAHMVSADTRRRTRDLNEFHPSNLGEKRDVTDVSGGDENSEKGDCTICEKFARRCSSTRWEISSNGEHANTHTVRASLKGAWKRAKQARNGEGVGGRGGGGTEGESTDSRKTNIAHVPRPRARRSVRPLRRILQENLVAFAAVICRIQCASMRSVVGSPRRRVSLEILPCAGRGGRAEKRRRKWSLAPYNSLLHPCACRRRYFPRTR